MEPVTAAKIAQTVLKAGRVISGDAEAEGIGTVIAAISSCVMFVILLFALPFLLLFGGEADSNANIDFCGAYPLPCGSADISSDYGVRVHPITGETKKHTGVDFTPEWHSSVCSIADGIVHNVSVNRAFGNCITIEHKTYAGTFYSFYAHLSKVNVSEGDEVKQGDEIALEGGDPKRDKNAGLSTGHHLHFEIRLSPEYGSDVNPKLYLKGEEASGNETGG